MHLLVYNPVSGKEGDDLNYLKDLFSEKEIDLEILVTNDKNSINKYFNESSFNFTCVIVAGGDGTISQTIESLVLHDINTKVLVFPRGTTNEYASTMNITRDTVVNYLEGLYEIKYVDIGVFNKTQTFTYSLIFGNFTHVTYETPQWLKNKLGYIAYWVHGVFSLYFLKLKRYKMKFEYNEEIVEDKFLFGSVSNSETLGKVIHLDDVSYSDGLLELFLVKAPKSLKEIRRLLYDARTGQNTSGLFIKEKIEKISVESPKSHSWSADGEFSGSFSKLIIEIKKQAISIVY